MRFICRFGDKRDYIVKLTDQHLLGRAVCLLFFCCTIVASMVFVYRTGPALVV